LRLVYALCRSSAQELESFKSGRFIVLLIASDQLFRFVHVGGVLLIEPPNQVRLGFVLRRQQEVIAANVPGLSLHAVL
jgi:hypothetical protein